MSQFHQQARQDSSGALDFDNLMEKQRLLLKEVATIGANSENYLTKNNQDKSSRRKAEDDIASVEEEEWISNWQFERIAPEKKTMTPPVNKKSKSDISVESEGGVFYFERIQPSTTAPAISSNPSVISTSDTNNAVTSIQASSSSVSNQKQEFDQHDFLLDMTIDNDDLFADLEAAADSNDDSEISLDDLMDMDIDDDQIHDPDDKLMRSLHASQNSGLHDVNDFLNKSLNKSTASNALMNDDDFEMMDNEDNEKGYSFSSPITSKATLSSSAPYGKGRPSNSPTSVARHMAAPPFMPSTTSMSSATTRPALQQMRKMMTDLLDNGSMPRRRPSTLPCAEGMDEMYLDTLRKLSASMERSKKTRKSLSIPMQTMQSSTHYSRSMCVNQILQSVQTSSRHVDTCLRSVSMMHQ